MQTDGIIGSYAIGGAVGATFYLEPVSTIDIDIFVSFQQSPGRLISLSPLYDYLVSKGFQAKDEYIVIHGWPVQFLPPSDALGEEALEQALETEVEGIPTRVFTAEHLVAIALQTGRSKDFLRILQFVEAGVLDVDKFDAIINRYGLLTKWEEFGIKFLKGNS